MKKRIIHPKQIHKGSKQKNWFIIGLLILFIILLGISIFFSYQSFQVAKQKSNLLRSKAIPSKSPFESILPNSEPTIRPTPIFSNNFNYQNFTINYPDDWTLLDMSISEDFPLKERLYPHYTSEKVIALNKNDLYLIITIEKDKQTSSGGIFLNNGQYNEFITDKDSLLIGNTIFYLNKNHHSISSLSESHVGAYVWSCLAEYLPSKITSSGNIFKGYENVIKRNGYAYNFIIVSDFGGQTPEILQSEIIIILQSINW